MRTTLVWIAALAMLWGAAARPALAHDGDELVPRFRVVNRVAVDSDTLEVTLRGALHNVECGNWRSAEVTWRSTLPGVQVVTPATGVGAIAPYGIAPTLGTIVLRIPKRLFRTLKKELRKSSLSTRALKRLRRAHARGKSKRRLEDKLARAQDRGVIDFRVLGTEIPVFTAGTVVVDEPTDTVFTRTTVEPDGSRMVTFRAQTTLLAALQPGQFLTVDPLQYEPESIENVPFPVEVLDVNVVGTDLVVHVDAADLDDVVVQGTIRGSETVTPPSGNTILPIWQLADGNYVCGIPDDNPCPPTPVPLTFNDIELGGSDLRLSGQFLWRKARLIFTFRFRNGAVQKASAEMIFSWTASVEVRAEADLVVQYQETDLLVFSIPIASFAISGIPINLSFGGAFVVGASADLRAGTVFGMHQVATLDTEVGWEDGAFFSDTFGDVSPVSISPPRLTDDTGASAEAFAALDLEIKVNQLAGPFVRTEAFGTLDVDPAGDPWWTTGIGLAQSGGFTVDLLGVNLAQSETPIWSTEKRIDSAGGGAPAKPRLAGEEARWAVAVQDPGGSAFHDVPSVAVLPDGSMVIAGRDTNCGYLVKLDPHGDLVWKKTMALRSFPVGIRATGDGTFIVAGQYLNSTWLAEHDGNGERLWVRSYEIPGADLLDFEVFEDDRRRTAYLLACRATDLTIKERDPLLVRLDDAADVVWAKQYRSPGVDYPFGIDRTAEGTFVLAGTTDKQVGVNHLEGNGLVFEVDEDGNQFFGVALGHNRDAWFQDVAAGPGGSIYAVGTVPGIVGDGYPSIWAARITTKDHQLRGVDHVLFGDGVGDSTTHDAAHAIVPSGGGFLLCGTQGLGVDRGGWVAKMTDELALSWFTQYDGVDGESFYDVAATPDGIAVVGESTSFTHLGPGADSSLVAMKLGAEGIVRFDASANATSRYLATDIYPSVWEPEFRADHVVLLDAVVWEQFTFNVGDVDVVAGSDPQPPVDAFPTVTFLSE